MPRRYISAAMSKAAYDLLPADEGYYGEIPGFQGVWANAPTLERCRDELKSALENWILFSVERGQLSLDRLVRSPEGATAP